jgi:hypothetical protein
MSKAAKKQVERDAIQLTIQARAFATTLFPEFVNDEDAIDIAEDEIYLLLLDNPDKSEEEIIGDVKEAIEETITAYNKPAPHPERVFTIFERLFA